MERLTRLRASLRHAFAVDAGPKVIDGLLQVPAEQAELVDRLCREVARRGLGTPALMFLEMSRPLNTVGASLMQFFAPIVSIVFDGPGYDRFAAFLEHRGSVEHLCRRIEHFSQEGAAASSTPASAASPVPSTTNTDPAARR